MGQSISFGSFLSLRLRLRLGNLLFRPVGPNVTRVSWNRVVKGPCNPPEIEALQYLALHTDIPVPKIYAIHIERNRVIYIEMSYIRGVTLEAAWDGLSTQQRDTIFADLKQHLSRLRDLPPPAEDIVCSAFQNPAYDCRIGSRFFGPITHQEFHSWTRKHLVAEDVESCLGRPVALTHTSRYRTCFTHADLAPRNIIVRRGRVAAIIDWGFAGWYPEYWEYVFTMRGLDNLDWSTLGRYAPSLFSRRYDLEYILVGFVMRIS